MPAPRLPFLEKRTNRQMTFSGEFNLFLDSLEKGSVSAWLENIGRETEEFKTFHKKVTKAFKSETERAAEEVRRTYNQ